VIAVLRHNLGTKILALVIALAAWGFTKATDPIEEWQMVFGIEVRLSEGSSLVSRFPANATVTAYVTGPVSRLERLQVSNPRVILDARGIPPGNSRMIEPRLERRFSGVGVDFEPQLFDMTVDATERKEFQPQEMAEGHLQAGYFIDSRIGLPTEIVVEGARSLLARVDTVVYNLNLSALTGSTELSVQFSAVDAEGSEVKNLTFTPPTADIAISLQPSQASKTVPVAVDVQGSPASNYALTSLSSDPFLVQVSGPAESLVGIVSVKTAPVNLTGKTSSFEQSVALLPVTEGVSLSASRATVRVTIEQIDTTYTFRDLLIERRGANPSYTYTLTPERVDVTIRGGPARISQVTSDLVRPQVDLADLEPGTYSVRVSVALPSGVRNDSVSPPSVSVTVSERGEGSNESQDGQSGSPQNGEPADGADDMSIEPPSDAG